MWYLNQDSLFWGRMLRLVVFLCSLSWKGCPSPFSCPSVSFRMSQVQFCRLSLTLLLCPSFCRCCIPCWCPVHQHKDLGERVLPLLPSLLRIAVGPTVVPFCVNSKFWSFLSLRSLTGTFTGIVYDEASKVCLDL